MPCRTIIPPAFEPAQEAINGMLRDYHRSLSIEYFHIGAQVSRTQISCFQCTNSTVSSFFSSRFLANSGPRLITSFAVLYVLPVTKDAPRPCSMTNKTLNPKFALFHNSHVHVSRHFQNISRSKIATSRMMKYLIVNAPADDNV